MTRLLTPTEEDIKQLELIVNKKELVPEEISFLSNLIVGKPGKFGKSSNFTLDCTNPKLVIFFNILKTHTVPPFTSLTISKIPEKCPLTLDLLSSPVFISCKNLYISGSSSHLHQITHYLPSLLSALCSHKGSELCLNSWILTEAQQQQISAAAKQWESVLFLN